MLAWHELIIAFLIYRFLRAMPAANKRAMKGECVVLVVLFISDNTVLSQVLF